MIEVFKNQKIIDEFNNQIGKEKIFTDKPTRTCYTITHGPECLLHEDYVNNFLPDAVIKPSCVEDVQNIVRISNHYKNTLNSIWREIWLLWC